MHSIRTILNLDASLSPNKLIAFIFGLIVQRTLKMGPGEMPRNDGKSITNMSWVLHIANRHHRYKISHYLPYQNTSNKTYP